MNKKTIFLQTLLYNEIYMLFSEKSKKGVDEIGKKLV